MRLINTETLQIEEIGSKIPEYAILSHTWQEGEEVTFQDMASPTRFEKRGWKKIIKTCEIAQRKYRYAWIDTCCIDKTSSAELTESINSMFEWYANAATCYVYLEDLKPGDAVDPVALKACRWFGRGWTLQELLAPSVVRIFDQEWRFRYTVRHVAESNTPKMQRFAKMLYEVTSIPSDVILGTTTLNKCSVAQRMSWAARRRTTRPEDMAYSLLGLFDVSMPLIYGEGVKAFRRLQEEIMKRNNDPTIFAWSLPPGRQPTADLGVIAPSPDVFGGCANMIPYGYNDIHFTSTNKGVLASSDWVLRTTKVRDRFGTVLIRYLVLLGTRGPARDHIGVYLRKVGPRLYYRDHRLPVDYYKESDLVGMDMIMPTQDYHLAVPLSSLAGLYQSYRALAIRIPPDDGQHELLGISPVSIFDATDRIFLRPKPYLWVGWPMILAARYRLAVDGGPKQVVALCGCRPDNSPFVHVFDAGKHPREGWLLGEEKLDPLTLLDLNTHAPELAASLSNSIELTSWQKKEYRLTASFTTENLGKPAEVETPVHTLRFKVEPVGVML